MALSVLAALWPPALLKAPANLGPVTWVALFLALFGLSLFIVSLLKSRLGSNPLPRGRPSPLPDPALTEQLRAIDWFQFERVVELAFRPSHSVTRRGGANPDGGIDLVIEKDGKQTAIQCKAWRNRQVGVKVVREMIGAMADANIPRGTIITLIGATPDAAALAKRHNIELIGDSELFTILAAADQSEVQRLLQEAGKICPKCEREMVLRTSRKGPEPGSQFWGCTGFPACRFVMKDDRGGAG